MTWSFRFFYILACLIYLGAQGDRSFISVIPSSTKPVLEISKYWQKHVTSLVTKIYSPKFADKRINSKGIRAASVLSTRSCFTCFEKWYKVFNDLDGVQRSLLVCMNHMNHEMYIHHSFLAPWVYLCSTSLKHSNTVVINRSLWSETSKTYREGPCWVLHRKFPFIVQCPAIPSVFLWDILHY